MDVVFLLATNAAVIIVAFLILWRVCLAIGDMTPVDAVWGLGMALVAASTYAQVGDAAPRQLLLLGLVTLWGVRLGFYMLWRWRHHGTDRRYTAMLGKVQAARGWSLARASLLMVFATQAPLLLVVCLPVQLGQVDRATPLGSVAVAGAVLSLFGILFESLGDWQLVRFKADPANQGQVMMRGLWRYTRHPNYFGDACAWWGMFLIAVETGLGLWALPGPLLLTWTLIKWSGAPTVERRMARTKPGYEDYIRRTSGFVPWPPRRA